MCIRDRDNLLEVHDHAAQVDERYVATSEDEEQVLKTMTLSIDPVSYTHLRAGGSLLHLIPQYPYQCESEPLFRYLP